MKTPRPPYQDPARPIAERVEDLLGRMTLEEKIGQMTILDGRRSFEECRDGIHRLHAGAFLSRIGEGAERLKREGEKTRLGIPILVAIDAIHGHSFCPGATIFPTQLALSCSWNPEAARRVGRVTAAEVRPTGVQWTFSPVLCIARDMRWGRINETFGEDPHLIGALAAAMIRGYEGDDRSAPDAILSCAKHFAAYSETQGGRDSSEADISERKLRSIFLDAFREAARAGAGSFMTAYHAIDGTPCSGNSRLLRGVLREEWGFEGITVTDSQNYRWMHERMRVAPTLEDAAALAIESGNDIMMNCAEFPVRALQALRSGRVSEARVDEACRRILRIKYELGLFDGKRHDDPERARRVVGCEAHRRVNYEVACQGLVLLKNEGGLLPLAGKGHRRIAVFGRNADDPLQQLGDWSSGSGQRIIPEGSHPRERIVTVLDGVKARAEPGVEVSYCPGPDMIAPATEAELAGVRRAAAGADLAIVVVGDVLEQTGERFDRANLDLNPGQQAMLEAVHASGAPMVVVLINGRPLTIPWVKRHAPAIVEAWNPGMEGGRALAAVLWGDENPCGKLTVSFPAHVGQQPVYYNQIPGWHATRYCDMPAEPLWAFGEGLSYTTYEYSGLALARPKIRAGEPATVSVRIRNTGGRDGVEIAQCYVNDLYASVTTPVRELKAFRRVPLRAGEEQAVTFDLPPAAFSLVDRECRRVVEPGEFEILVGPSSRDADLLRIRLAVEGERPVEVGKQPTGSAPGPR